MRVCDPIASTQFGLEVKMDQNFINVLVPLLVAAVQELSAEIPALKIKVGS